MRVDIFLRYPSKPCNARLYLSGVTLANSKAIVAALERDGEKVLVCRHNRSGLGKFVYETAAAVQS